MVNKPATPTGKAPAPQKPAPAKAPVAGKDKLTYWLVLCIGAPLVVLVSVWVGRGLARLVVRDPPSARMQAIEDGTSLEDSSEDAYKVVDMGQEGDADPREAARRAIEEARNRQGSLRAPETSPSRREDTPPEETGDDIEVPDNGAQEEPFDSDAPTGGPDEPVDDDLLDLDADLGSREGDDGLVETGEYPSPLPSRNRDKVNSGAGQIPPPPVKPKQPAPSDDEDLFDDDPSNTPSYQGNPTLDAPPKPQGGKPPAAPGDSSSRAPLPPRGSYAVQVASFNSKDSAESLSRELGSRGYRAGVEKTQVGDREIYKVKVGSYGNREQAEAAAKSLQMQNYTGFVQEN